jgi:hypothetical protein
MSSYLQDVASRFGLSQEAGPGGELLGLSRLRGVIDGQQVRCERSNDALRVEALFAPALDLGLSVSMRYLSFGSSGERRLVLGDPSFDDELDAQADSPARASALFSDELRGAVLGLNASQTGLLMRDDGISVGILEGDRAAIETALPALARAAAIVAEARRRVPVAEQLRPYSVMLVRLGKPRGLVIESAPLSAAGALGDVSLQVRFPRVGHCTFEMEARVSPLEGTVGMGLLVRRESLVDRVRTFFGGQDLRTGDAAFDPAFLVRATDGERALVALDGDVRALLLELAARFEEVTLSDAGLSLRGPAARVPPGETQKLLEAAQTVTSHVARASGAAARGPYR